MSEVTRATRSALDLRRMRREDPVGFLHELEALAECAATGVTRDFWAALVEIADAEPEGSKALHQP